MKGTFLMSKRIFLASSLLALAGFLTGCAHPISLNSDLNQIKPAGAVKVSKRVGYVITEDSRKLEVTTPGGGGDKVSYFPYKDLEAGVHKSLTEVFADVVRLAGPNDPRIQTEKLNFVITPTILTNSSSSSPFTWPPTLFTIELTCKVTDDKGVEVTQVKAKGEGRAEFSEFKADFSLSAKRAAEQALNNLVKAVAEDPKLR
jgi:hypothetical protein